MPSRARHGTPIRVTAEEYARIMAAYGSPEEVNAMTVMGETPELPDTVTINTGTEEVQKAVTWNLDGVSFEGNPYSYVKVTGAVEGSTVEAVANVQIIPANIEYMIDCNNPDSETWKRIAEAGGGLLNTEAADQAKMDDNAWGYTSIVGSDDSADMTGYSQSSASNPYTGCWRARGGKNISYQVTLPAGEHTIMLGCTGWWSMGRQMDVFYSVNGGAETKLCDFDAVNGQPRYASGTITLDEEAVVTLTVKKADGNDPILSWIAVSGIAEGSEISLDELQNAVNEANALNAEDYTSGSYQAVSEALDAASAELLNPTSQAEVDAAADALNAAVAALVDISDLRAAVEKYADLTSDAYTEESYAAFEKAYAAAEEVLANADATKDEVENAAANLEAAVEGLQARRRQVQLQGHEFPVPEQIQIPLIFTGLPPAVLGAAEGVEPALGAQAAGIAMAHLAVHGGAQRRLVLVAGLAHPVAVDQVVEQDDALERLHILRLRGVLTGQLEQGRTATGDLGPGEGQERGVHAVAPHRPVVVFREVVLLDAVEVLEVIGQVVVFLVVDGHFGVIVQIGIQGFQIGRHVGRDGGVVGKVFVVANGGQRVPSWNEMHSGGASGRHDSCMLPGLPGVSRLCGSLPLRQ